MYVNKITAFEKENQIPFFISSLQNKYNKAQLQRASHSHLDFQRHQTIINFLINATGQ